MELNSIIGIQLIIIKHLNQELGLKYSFQQKIEIPREKIENLKPYLMENWQKIHDSFGLLDHSKALKSHDKFESHIKLIQKYMVIGVILLLNLLKKIEIKKL